MNMFEARVDTDGTGAWLVRRRIFAFGRGRRILLIVGGDVVDGGCGVARDIEVDSRRRRRRGGRDDDSVRLAG